MHTRCIENAIVLVLFILTMCAHHVAAFKPFYVPQRCSKTVLNVYKNGSYRLWDDTEGIKSLPVIGKATGNLLNLAADLLRIQGIVCLLIYSILPCVHSFHHSSIIGPNSILPQEEFKNLIYEEVMRTGKNGASRTKEQESNIDSYVKVLEKYSPTSSPAYSSKMDGMWKLLYTDFTPAAASSGKLGRLNTYLLVYPYLFTHSFTGPFIGDVYQKLDSNLGIIKNILKLNFLGVEGCLVAKQSVLDSSTWQIEFDRLENSVAGFKLPVTKFKTREIRLWKIVYLDNDLRILRAKRPDSAESFLFILRREQGKW